MGGVIVLVEETGITAEEKSVKNQREEG